MSDQPKWLPSDEEIRSVFPAMTYRQRLKVATIARSAVEKALAEQREAMALDVDLAKMCAERLAEELRVLRLIIQSDKVQRRREVIEARICGIQAVKEGEHE